LRLYDHFARLTKWLYDVQIYRETRLRVASLPKHMANATWQSWIEFESSKRLLGGLFVLSIVGMVIFDVAPGFDVTQDLEFEEFHDEALWKAATAGEWRELHASSRRPGGESHRSIREIVLHVISESGTTDAGGGGAPTNRASAFSELVVAHAIVLHMHQLLGVAQSFCRRGSETYLDSFSSSLLSVGLKSLARCQEMLLADANDSLDGPLDWVQMPLLSSCQAMLRIAHIRLFRVTADFNRLSLISPEPTVMEASVARFAATRLERSPVLLTVVSKCVEEFAILVRMGPILVHKTAALDWSVQNAIACWECGMSSLPCFQMMV